MKNNGTIRTMQDDLKDIENNIENKNEKQKLSSEIVQGKIQQADVQSNVTQPMQSNITQDVSSGAKQSLKLPNGEDKKLKEIVERISSQTNKSPNDKHQVGKKETEGINNSAHYEDKNKEIENNNNKDVHNDNIDALKGLINKISKPTYSFEEKSENKDENLKATKEKNISDDTIGHLIQQPKENIKENIVEEKQIGAKKTETINTITSSFPRAKKSFWDKILKKVSSFGNKKELSNIKSNDIVKEEKINQSGVLENKKDIEQKKVVAEQKNLSKKEYYDKNYIDPNERLIHGKQKFYSSISKRIKLREDGGELNELKNTVKAEKQKKTFTEEEKYKKLKQSIIQKYHIKIFSLPWKKIILVTFFVLFLVGIISYFIFSKAKPPVSPPPPDIVVGSELKEFLNLKKSITITKKKLKGFNNLETDALAIFGSDKNIKVIKLIIIDNETNKKMLPLREAFDAIGIINIGEKTNFLPEKFLQEATNNYDLFIFKTKKNSIRYGLAIKIDDEPSMSEFMKNWEKEKSTNKKMTTIFKPLFRSDRNFGEVFNQPSEATYKGVKIKYINLINKETALDYFIYKNILSFATSKDSAFTMIDLLTSNK